MTGEQPETLGDLYERDMVPVMFRPFALDMIARLDLRPGMRVADVGCGTGIVGRLIGERLDAESTVIGVDINVPMLDVARRSAASLPCRSEWYEASAEALPIAAEAVDLLVSQFAFMLFPDKDQAAREMHRVLAPGGALYVSAWRHFSHQPNYAALIDGIGRLESAEAADLLMGAFRYKSPDELRAPFSSAGFTTIEIEVVGKDVNFGSADHFVRTVVAGSILGRMGIVFEAEVLEALVTHVADALAPYAENGELAVPMETYLARAVK